MVIVPMNGAIISGASVCPTNVFAAAESVSEPEVRMVRRMIHANTPTNRCMMPK